ncbi:hypothetical protein ZWY2020_025754 [Hordeum vulgare]|nr:hypothetical protein ZWY2020_025754 [Hordeum vulgare]
MWDKAIDIIAISETMRTDFSLPELERLSRHLFAWHWLPSSGVGVHSGGILLGVKDTTFEVEYKDQGEFFLSMEVWERDVNFKWEVIVVYGMADHTRSQAFLDELHQKIEAETLPIIIAADFNLLWFPLDKNNAWVDIPSMQYFNDWIADLGIRELNPMQIVLNGVFMSPDWETRFPHASLWAITRIGSDHVPLLLSSVD